MWEISSNNDGFVIFTDGRWRLRLQSYSDNVIRVTQTDHEEFCLNDEPMISRHEVASKLSVDKIDGGFVIDAGRLSAALDADTGRLIWSLDGQVVMREPEKRGRVLREIDIIRQKFDPDAPLEEYVSVDGMRARASGTPYIDRKGYQTKLSFEFDDDEDIYGLGQHEEGILNYRGQHQFLYQHNLKISCPVIYSSNGWAVLNNCAGAQIFHDDAFGSYISADAADELDYFVIGGPEFDQLLAGIRYLTGDVPLLPRWALGYVQCKEHYNSSEELLDIAREYRARNIPIDCVVQDWQSWPKGQWGQKTPDHDRYPDVKALTDGLHDMHVKLMLSLWPNMNGNCPDQLEMLEHGYMLGNRQTYNVFDPDARKAYWAQCNREWFPNGLDAWWADCTEPFEADWYGEEAMLPEDRMQWNLAEFKRYIDPTQVLAYSSYHSRGIYEGQRATTDDKRVTILTRSGLTGQQRYGTICWNGDTSATWDVLRRTIPDGLNLMLGGIPYWTVDAGGFFVKRWQQWFGRGEYEEGCADPAYRELYVRWLQLGAFLPMMRSHGADTPREVWRFGEPGEPYYDAIVDLIRLRYMLMPYIYSEMARVHFDRSSLMRMLAFDFRLDKTARNIDDEFMFGRSMLICPVTSPAGEDGYAERDVYLPAGVKWYDFWNGEEYEGGQWLRVAVPLNGIPVFVPAGSVIPTGPDISYADEGGGKSVSLRIYPGKDADYRLYNDSGDGYGYERGEYWTADIHWDDAKQALTIDTHGDKRFACDIDY